MNKFMASMAMHDRAAVGILVVVAIAFSVFVSPWLLMLLLGAVHGFVSSVPALGYWQSFLVTLLLGVLGSILRGGK